MEKFQEFRNKYPVFIYRGYSVEETEIEIKITYEFSVPGLSDFHPTWRFPKADARPVMDGNATMETMVFSLGMVELVSYWKIACPPKVVVEAGYLNQEQIGWWKELYFHGLGEFFYTNGIEIGTEVTRDNFMEILSEGSKPSGQLCPLMQAAGCMIPIGGGKDSAVSLELLKQSGEELSCYIINGRGATNYTAEAGGIAPERVIESRRTLDKNMLELNRHGYLNGHTPFSAIVAFSSIIAAYMHGIHYVPLSNESSANESTVMGSTVNHQYSKSFQFERDFHEYEEGFIGSGVYYFSLLRPLSEFQIAKYFAKSTAYHDIFRSCNVGSKTDSWCGHCPKCLFVNLILSPFISTARLNEIFGADMLNDESLTGTLEQLVGIQEEKPFECVGSRDEINTAVCLTIGRMEAEGERLPKLFAYYKTVGLYEKNAAVGDTFSGFYDDENLLPEKFAQIVRRECTEIS